MLRCSQCGSAEDFADAPQMCRCGTCNDMTWHVTPERYDEMRAAPIPKPAPVESKRSKLPFPHIIGDRLAKHYDHSVGEIIDSKSQRKRLYDVHDLNMHSGAELVKKRGDHYRKGKTILYAGKKDNTKPEDPRIVRAGDGRQLL